MSRCRPELLLGGCAGAGGRLGLRLSRVGIAVRGRPVGCPTGRSTVVLRSYVSPSHPAWRRPPEGYAKATGSMS
jgi:hypothetical protein